MKKNIHPVLHEITITMTDKTTYKSRSTMPKDLVLDVDPLVHNAWTGGGGALRKTGQMEKFSNKFAFLNNDTGAAKKAETENADDKKSA